LSKLKKKIPIRVGATTKIIKFKKTYEKIDLLAIFHGSN
jgi:hypothetical protein